MNWQFRRIKSRLASLGWRLLPGGVAALGVGVLLRLGAWQPLEYMAYSALFHLRGPLPPDPRVVVVSIDDPSLEALGRFPLPRRYYAQLIDTLADANASVVVLDLVLSEATPDDRLLLEAMQNQGRVVLAQAWNSTGSPLPPTQTLEQGAIAIGHILKRPDADGITRRVDPQIQAVPALGIAAVQAYELVQERVTIPDLSQPLWINWFGGTSQIPDYSLAAVLNGSVSPDVFHNKIVVVGTTAAGLDSLITPYNRTPPASGVDLHATVISNVLQHNFLHGFTSNQWLMLLLVGSGPILSAVLVERSFRQQLLIWLGLCVGWFILAVLAFGTCVWLPIASPIVLFSLTTATTGLSQRLRINIQLQHEIEQIWQTYCHDLLVWAAIPETKGSAELTHLQSHSSSHEPQPIAQLAQLAELFGRSQSAHAAIARNLSIGLLAADWDGLVWFCNPVAAERLHIHMGDRLQPHVVPQWLSQTQWELALQQLHNANPISQEIQQGDRWFAITLEPLVYQPAQLTSTSSQPLPTGMLLLLEDITLRKQAEAETHRAMEQEKELYELKSRFVTIASHEFRTPLTIILGSTELLENYGHRWDDDKKRTHFRQIQMAVGDMIELLDDVLLLSQAEAGKLTFTPQPLNLKTFCAELAQQLETSAGNQHHINLTMHNVPTRTCMDEKLLRQIFINLLSNAIKYSPNSDSVDFIVTCTPDTATFQVCDRGIGVPAESLQHLFEPFYRADNTGNVAGTGLGLAIVSESVALHNGRISVQSELNMGTQITVVLPTGVSPTSNTQVTLPETPSP